MFWHVSPSDFISQNSVEAAQRRNSDLRREARQEMEEFEKDQKAFKARQQRLKEQKQKP